MVLTPLNSPIHTKPRSRRPATSSPTLPMPALPSPPQAQPSIRIMSPTPDETTSPRAENVHTFFSNSGRNFSSSTDFSEKIVEEVSQPEPTADPDDGFLFAQDLLETVRHPAAQETDGLGWKGWLGVGIVGAISFGAFIVAGQASKEKPNKERKLYYHLG